MIERCIPEDAVSVVKAYLPDVVKNGTVAHVVASFRLENQERWFDIRITPLISRQTNRNIIVAMMDVTEAKQAEERTLKTEEKLKNIERMEMLSNLATGVAHEVRNPLNAIMVNAEALSLSIGENSDLKQHISYICTQVIRLSELMTALLQLGKPLERSNLRPLEIVDLCRDSIDLWRQSHLSKGYAIRLVAFPGMEKVQIYAEEYRLKQVFLNLFDNAAHHSLEGSDIVLEIEEPENNMVTIKVVDRGMGISSFIQNRLFKPFFSTRAGGTGLGLFIVKNIIEAHGGTMLLRNNDPPPGTCAEIRLPIVEG